MSRAGLLLSQTSTLNCAGNHYVYFSGTLRSDGTAFSFLSSSSGTKIAFGRGLKSVLPAAQSHSCVYK